MKILWVSPFFLHPTDRGGQIRTLGTLKELHKRHEVHFAALNNPANREGPERSREYSASYTAIDHEPPSRGSVAILPQLAASLVRRMPMAVFRYYSPILKHEIRRLAATGNFDSTVCDFLASAPNMPDLGTCVLFQHNVETTIWRRHADQTASRLKRHFFAMQARKMEAYEGWACRKSKAVIAVSDVDAARIEKLFGVQSARSVRTGVDLSYFSTPAARDPTSDIVFCGSMDWLPNIDAVEYFLNEIFPAIIAERPGTKVIIAGRSPDARLRKVAEAFPEVTVTGDVPDMRPFLWGAKISIVPIRIAGGTRLKIYECMAAGLPVVSTSVGAEGLSYTEEENILIEDSPLGFAAACLRLLRNESARITIARKALALVQERFSWESVTRDFEAILEENRLAPLA